MVSLRCLAALGALCALSPSAGAMDADKLKAYGQHLSGECTTCHRIDGVDNGIPAIIGWKVDDFVATLQFYQSGQRSNPAMVSVAQSLEEQQVKALAVYFGSLAASGAPATASAAPASPASSAAKSAAKKK